MEIIQFPLEEAANARKMKLVVLVGLAALAQIVSARSVESGEAKEIVGQVVGEGVKDAVGVKMPAMGQEMVDYINNNNDIPFMVSFFGEVKRFHK